MKFLHKLIIDCDTSAHYCDKLQYNEASAIERFHFKMHILICKLCKAHSTRNTKLSEICKRANLVTMPKADKAILKAKLEKEMRQ